MESTGRQKHLQRSARRIRLAAVELAKRFGITELDPFFAELADAWAGYELHCGLVDNPETLTQAKSDMQKIAKGARALAGQLEGLGRTTMSVTLAFAGHMEPSNCLSLPVPVGVDLPEGWTDFNNSHPRSWIPCLIELASLCSMNENLLHRLGKTRGRSNFSERFFGTADEVLTEECEAIAARHGRHSQADVLEIVQAVKRAGDGRRSLVEVGRSTVRRRFKFTRNLGTQDHA